MVGLRLGLAALAIASVLVVTLYHSDESRHLSLEQVVQYRASPNVQFLIPEVLNCRRD
jgi:hypothetical protein